MTHSVYQQHNHAKCIDTALEQAIEICKGKDARLTATRQEVLKLIWQSHKPVGAYDLLPQLDKKGFNSAPPTVYRALEFLLEMRLIHRINSLNAFVGCSHPNETHANCFFICKNCGVAQEVSSQPLLDMQHELEKSLGVAIEEQVTEFAGLCPPCKSTNEC